jgi:hypothetical protein
MNKFPKSFETNFYRDKALKNTNCLPRKIKSCAFAAWWSCVAIGALIIISFSNPAQAQVASSASKVVESEGVLDNIQINGNALKARGWAGPGDSANPVVGISIVVDGVEIYSGGLEKQQRPDVARAKSRSDWLESGWNIKAPLSLPIPDGPRKITATATLKNGDHFDLRVPEKSGSLALPSLNSLKTIDKPAPPKAGTTSTLQMAWLAALLLVGFIGWIAYLKFQHPRTLSPMAPDAPAPFQ